MLPGGEAWDPAASSGILEWGGGLGFLRDELEGFFDEDFAGHFAERHARYVIVSRKALEIDLRQDVAEGVIGEAEEEVVLAAHFSFEVEADVGHRLAGDREDAGVAKLYEVDAGANGAVFGTGVVERRVLHDRPEGVGFNRETDFARG